MIISIPLTIEYLGEERFGLWMIISSFLLFLSTFSDLGLGVSYMNSIADAKATQNNALSRIYTSNVFFSLILGGLILLIIFFFLNPFLNWSSILNIKSSQASSEISNSVIVLFILFCVGLPFVTVEKFQEGSQEGYKSNLWQSLGSLLSLFGIYLTVYFQLGLSALVAATLGLPIMARIINFIIQFRVTTYWNLPRTKDWNMEILIKMLKPGMIFFAISTFHVIGYNSDNFIITKMLDPSSVAVYGVVQKASLLALVFWSFNTSLWPAYTEALARKDYGWIKKTIKRTVLLNLIFGVFIGIFLTVFGSWIITKWTNGVIVPPFNLLLGFSVYIIVNGLVGCFAIVYNSSFILKWQLILIVLSSVSSIFVKIFLCARFGISGVVWGTAISYTIFFIAPSILIVDRLFVRKLIL